jgi:3-deoxy-D-manno-octulosonic-acid transferase
LERFDKNSISDYNFPFLRETRIKSMRYLIDVLYLIGIVAYSPKIIYRRLAHGRYKGGWGQRLGSIKRRNPDKPCIWIHAVSVGEVNATRTVVETLRRRFPDYPVAISATTDTGLAAAKSLYEKEHDVFYFPFDLSCVMKKAITRINPAVICLMELEVWPNLARFASQKGIPLSVINGRISDGSFPKYLKMRRVLSPMFGRVSLVLAQTEEYAQRFVALGCPPDRVKVTGSLKYDTAQVTAEVPGAARVAEQINRGRERLWVLGGTGPGEEEIGLEVFKSLRQEQGFDDLRLVIVPRKPERFDEVAELIDRAGFGYVRFSELKNTDACVSGKPTVILGDTMGDLKKFYAIATIVFVGRSLVPMGGSDMMESAALGKCTLFGPHTFNFKQTVEVLLKDQGAIEVKDSGQLLSAMRTCLKDGSYTERIANNGQSVIRRNQGATQISVDAIVSLINESKQQKGL